MTDKISMIWNGKLSNVILVSDTTGWTFKFYGITFGQLAIGIIQRVKP